MAKLLTWFILCYKKLLSPFLGPHCRFYPSCSSYFIQALETHGAGKGFLLGMKRVARCHPLTEGGMDPVPEISCKQCGDTSNDNTDAGLSVNEESGIKHGY